MLEPELRLVLEPTRLACGGGWEELLFPSLRSGFGVWRPDRGLLRSNLAFFPGTFFSLANLAWRATREILWVLGELEPEAAEAAAGLEADLEGCEAGAEDGALALAVVVIRRPAAVFRGTAAPADKGLEELEVIVVLARVILGLEAVLEEEEEVDDLTLLANDEVVLTWDLTWSADLSLFEEAV